jgi:hypothetical protein
MGDAFSTGGVRFRPDHPHHTDAVRGYAYAP